jgi:hypothetical protein
MNVLQADCQTEEKPKDDSGEKHNEMRRLQLHFDTSSARKLLMTRNLAFVQNLRPKFVVSLPKSLTGFARRNPVVSPRPAHPVVPVYERTVFSMTELPSLCFAISTCFESAVQTCALFLGHH